MDEIFESKNLNSFFIRAILSLSIANFYSLETVKNTVIVGMEGKNSYGKLWEDTFNQFSGAEPTMLIGGNDQLSIEAARWFAAKTSGKLYKEVHVDKFPYEPNKASYIALRKRNSSIWTINPEMPLDLKGILNKNYFKQIILIRKVGDKSEVTESLKTLENTDSVKLIFKKTYEDRELFLFKCF